MNCLGIQVRIFLKLLMLSISVLAACQDKSIVALETKPNPLVIHHMVTPMMPSGLGNLGRIRGNVLLGVVFSADGRVSEVEVIQDIGKGKFGFADAAIKALKQWTFEPLTCEQKKQDLVARIGIAFCYSASASRGGCDQGIYSAEWLEIEVLPNQNSCLDQLSGRLVIRPE